MLAEAVCYAKEDSTQVWNNQHLMDSRPLSQDEYGQFLLWPQTFPCSYWTFPAAQMPPFQASQPMDTPDRRGWQLRWGEEMRDSHFRRRLGGLGTRDLRLLVKVPPGGHPPPLPRGVDPVGHVLHVHVVVVLLPARLGPLLPLFPLPLAGGLQTGSIGTRESPTTDNTSLRCFGER